MSIEQSVIELVKIIRALQNESNTDIVTILSAHLEINDLKAIDHMVTCLDNIEGRLTTLKRRAREVQKIIDNKN